MKKKFQKKSDRFLSSQCLVEAAEMTLIQKKLPKWASTDGLTFPTKLALEQCSGEQAALYKQSVVRRLFPEKGKYMADLTGGLGVDFSYIVTHFEKGIYIERQKVLCDAARENFSKLGIANAEIKEGDGIAILAKLHEMDLIFIDPARRDHIGKKTVFIEDCEPDVVSLLPLLWSKTNCIMIKLSPMLDLTSAMKSLQKVSEAHIVAENGECKELLLVLQHDIDSTKIFCIDNDRVFSFLPIEETEAQVRYASNIRKYLYEPSASILKAGAFKLVGQRFGLEKLHPNSHLYTADQYVKDFPGRKFEVKQVSSFAKKELKALCESVDWKANLTIRNFPGSVADLRKRIKLKEGGNAYWFATTITDEKHVIISCEKVKEQ